MSLSAGTVTLFFDRLMHPLGPRIMKERAIEKVLIFKIISMLLNFLKDSLRQILNIDEGLRNERRIINT